MKLNIKIEIVAVCLMLIFSAAALAKPVLEFDIPGGEKSKTWHGSYRSGREFTDPVTGMEFVWVSGGVEQQWNGSGVMMLTRPVRMQM